MSGHINVCPKRAPWALPMARMFKGESLDTYPTVFDQSVNMQWDLSEVLLGAKTCTSIHTISVCGQIDLFRFPCGRISCVPTVRIKPPVEKKPPCPPVGGLIPYTLVLRPLPPFKGGLGKVFLPPFKGGLGRVPLVFSLHLREGWGRSP